MLKFALLLLATFTMVCSSAAARDRVDLHGNWEFRLDPEGAGLAQKWYRPETRFDRQIKVPGAWQAQGVGSRSGILRNHYSGTAWYRRTVNVPASWAGTKIALHIGGAHRRTTVFVNGVELGGHDGFSAPFDFDITSAVKPGADNHIVIRLENPPVNIEASPDKQEPVLPSGMLNYIANWGGIYGAVTLESAPRTRLGHVLVLSDVANRSALFRVELSGEQKPAVVRVNVPGAAPATGRVAEGRAEIRVPLPNAPLWTPDNAELLTARIELMTGDQTLDRIEQRFGFREISTTGRTLLLNGKPFYLRGYGDDNVEVLTGFPPSSRAVFIERLKRAKSFGFNAVRFHSMPPPAEYFEAADEVGMLVMAELPAAYTQYFFAHRDFLKRELAGVLLAYRNHPSLLSLAFGNEFNLRWLKTDADRSSFLASVGEFYKAAKELAPGTLIMSNDGFDMRPSDMFSLYRGAPEDRPTVRHEFGQYYCSLPDISLIDQFTGAVIPEWLETKKKWVEQNGLTDAYATYVRNSQRLQHLGRKYQIERVREDSRVSGYHYWLIVDYPGGTGEGDSWEEGWFDYFWQPKGITPNEGRELNTPVLLMIDAGVDQRTMWVGDRKRIGIRVSNYGPEPIRNARLSWALVDGSKRIQEGELSGVNVDLGTVAAVGHIDVRADNLETARKLQLVVTLQAATAQYQNRWDLWAYPRLATWQPSVPVSSTVRLAALRRAYAWLQAESAGLDRQALLITDVLDANAQAHLRAGGRVWLMLRQTPQLRGVEFFPASGGAFGTRIQEHPALRAVPTDGFCDLQFYNLVNGAYPLPIGGSDPGAFIDGVRTTSEFLSKSKNLQRIAYAMEGKVGDGRLLVTTMRLREHFDDEYPEALTMFDALLRYTSSADFMPKSTLPNSMIERLGAE